MSRRNFPIRFLLGTLAFGALNAFSQPLKITKVGAWESGAFCSVSVQNSFAYVADGKGLTVIDIKVPTAPYITGSIKTTGEANHVRAAGDYAYVTDEKGLNIILIADPQHPQLAALYPMPEKAVGVFVLNGYAYVAAGSTGLLILNVKDPAKPAFEGWYDTPGDAKSVFVNFPFAYVADGASGLQVIDISNPSSPALAGSYDTPGTSMDVFVQGLYAYVADGTSGLQIIDIRDPYLPILAGTWSRPWEIKCLRVHVKGVYAYVSLNGDGLWIIRISDPAAPAEVRTSIFSREIDIEGPYAYVAGSDFQIIDISNPNSFIVVGNMAGPSYFQGPLGAFFYGALTASGTKLYVNGGQGMLIINVSDASSPVLAGFYDTLNLPIVNPARQVPLKAFGKGDDVYLMTTAAEVYTYKCKFHVLGLSDPSSPQLKGSLEIQGQSSGFAISGNYAYVLSGGWTAHPYSYLHIIDISNPTSPALVRSKYFSSPGLVYAANNFLFAQGISGLYIHDISNPTSPSYLGEYSPSDGTMAADLTSIAVVGRYAYLAYGFSGVHIVDLLDPAKPAKVGSYSTQGTACDIFGSGDFAYIVAGEQGLLVLDISNPLSPTLAGSYKVSGSAESVWVDDKFIYVVDRLDCRVLVLRAEREADMPKISVRPSRLVFGAGPKGEISSPQSLRISNAGVGTLNWSVMDDASWLSCSPGSGRNSGIVMVSVDAKSLAPGTYGAQIAVYDGNASTSPQTIPVTLNVYGDGSSAPPFGSFDTPIDETTGITGAIPVTGWVLDDIEPTKVEIWRDAVIGETAGIWKIGDAIFVEGARPDVEQAYPDYPLNYRAGWGYMLLTNMLPNHGNGTYKLYAYAYDKEENKVLLGTKTIVCDNAHAVKPFGTIDSPQQGGAASGNSYWNFGWVLTPLTKTVSKDGSTILVYMDGAYVGNLATAPNVYNQYRADVSEAFPGLNNTGAPGVGGPVGAYFLDTTKYPNGLHTIQWVATDDGGAADGIGSRYFNIVNMGVTSEPHKVGDKSSFRVPDSAPERTTASVNPREAWSDGPLSQAESFSNILPSFDPVAVKRGFDRTAPAEIVWPDNYGTIRLEMREVERLEVDLGKGKGFRGYMIVGGERRPLPIGSTFDPIRGLFSWMPGPGFLGTYELVFLRDEGLGMTRRIPINVLIKPKFGRL